MTDIQMSEYLPFLIPLIILELVLAVTALVSIMRHPHYRLGNRLLWILLVVLVQPFGSIGYFLLGREGS